ncbi:TPA: DUF2184 domain-containing protein [Escherichia coli]|nr:DUF2184 domain-containing protein [Escherichia coli]
MLVEWSYRSSWIIGEAVDAIPDDMTRKGIRITSEIDAKDRGILESQLDELQIWDALNDVLKWSRLYGGAVGFIMIEGQAPMTPLRPETTGKGKFKGILPLDRWMIDPVLTRRIKDMGPDLGKPEFYDVVTTATGIPAWRIHHSRLIRFDGVTLPFQQKMTENEWGMSVVERIGKSGNPLNLWGMELGWTVIELQAAQQVGRPIDTQKYDGMQLKWQMDNDEQVYVGDSALNLKGLVTLDGVPVNNAAKTWATSTPDEIRASINQALSDAWAASGYSVVPRDLLIPPEQFALLSSIIVSSAGNQSLLTYLQTNTISYHQNGVPLNIRAVKWLKGRGVGKKDRMVAYTNDKKYVRYPLVPLQSVPVQYRGLYQIVTYYGKLGAVEPVYKETISYVDGI